MSSLTGWEIQVHLHTTINTQRNYSWADINQLLNYIRWKGRKKTWCYSMYHRYKKWGEGMDKIEKTKRVTTGWWPRECRTSCCTVCSQSWGYDFCVRRTNTASLTVDVFFNAFSRQAFLLFTVLPRISWG